MMTEDRLATEPPKREPERDLPPIVWASITPRAERETAAEAQPEDLAQR